VKSTLEPNPILEPVFNAFETLARHKGAWQGID